IMIKKLLSKRGQISMELSILIAAAVAVAAIASFYYIKNVRDSMSRIETTNVTNALNSVSERAARRISKLVNS
ncbi:class III signal peptide-containing protein, partial [Methanocaldococcus infernus]